MGLLTFDAGDFVFISGAVWDLVVRIFCAFSVSINVEAVLALLAFFEV